ncbi:hypothetical protein MtrunA17_Chr6g0456171 [Medicago truncatula]|uniref:Uncharacterized protein n=1 Tax=Medicago truncatula TaxID=3880 RepID=A0A396HAG5_MEDTR|nr:hypothetical protein MtrunA17_Chr6g0456171 [Medicago truncatula]
MNSGNEQGEDGADLINGSRFDVNKTSFNVCTIFIADFMCL